MKKPFFPFLTDTAKFLYCSRYSCRLVGDIGCNLASLAAQKGPWDAGLAAAWVRGGLFTCGRTGRVCALCTAQSCWQELQPVPPSSSTGTELHPPSVTLQAVLKDKTASKYFDGRLGLREMKLIQSK